MLYMFYKDSSTISRPDRNGKMTCLKTIQAIVDKIASLHNGERKAEILTVDSQDSPNQAYIIIVTGVLVGENNMKRKFTQAFFLGPQEKGHFILNDIFRYLDGPQDLQTTSLVTNGVQDLEPKVVKCVSDEPLEAAEELDIGQNLPVSEEQITKALQKEGEVAILETSEEQTPINKALQKEEEVTTLETPEEQTPITKALQKEEVATLETPKEQTPKQVSEKATFLSVLMKENTKPVPVPTIVRKVPINAGQKGHAPSQLQAASQSLDLISTATENGMALEEQADGLSIYLRNLPLNATTTLLEKEFRRFGPIKQGGIQVKRNEERLFCYGFIRFESSTSIQNAIKESPLTISGHQVYIEKKRPSGSRAQLPSRKANHPNKITRGSNHYARGGDSTNLGVQKLRYQSCNQVSNDGANLAPKNV